MQNRFMELVEQTSMKESVPHFEIGDTVDVHVRILEGEKERIQVFNGVVIARSGANTREMFTVRRIVQGEGVERIFPVHSPRIADIVVKRSARVRRAKLYFLRERSGKSVRLKERPLSTQARISQEELDAAKSAKKEAKVARKAAKAEKKAVEKAEKQAVASTGEKPKRSKGRPKPKKADTPPTENGGGATEDQG